MNTLHAIIEFSDNNLSAYIKEVGGVIGIGDTLEEVKQSLNDSLEIYIEECIADGYKLPNELSGEYTMIFQFDICSFLKCYSPILSKSGLEFLTGIHQKQLWHYASGKSKPRKETVKKVQDSIHKFAEELCSCEFI